MSRKFKKNNYVSDSESDSEDTDESSEIQTSSESSNCSRNEGKMKQNVFQVESSDFSTENEDIEESDESVVEDSLPSVSRIHTSSPEKVIDESVVQDSSTCESKSEVSFIEDISSIGRRKSQDIEHLTPTSINSGKSIRRSLIRGKEMENANLEESNAFIQPSTDIQDSSDEREDSICVLYEKSSSPKSPLSYRSTADDDSRDSGHRSTSTISSDRSILERQIAVKRAAYQNIMRAIHTCDPKKLADGGKLLQEKMVRCKEELEELEIKLKDILDYNPDSPVPVKTKITSNSMFSTKDQNIQNLGKKGMEKHTVQAALTIDALVTMHESLNTCPTESTFEKDPQGLKVELMAHQKQALAWLLWRERQAPPGGILADDMGLGKTLSIISLVLRSEEYKSQNNNVEEENDQQGSVQIVDGVRTYKGKTLVVCPASLAGQWEEQIKTHCKVGLLKTLIHHGKSRELQAKRLAGYDVVITTYGLLAEENKYRDNEKKGVLFRVRWERIVLDEAHIIRNHKTQKAVAACDLIGKYRWCLTGTPVHNRELDMYSLLKFIRCEPFDDRNVWKRWVDNKSAQGVQRLKTVIKFILLRRTKEDLKKQGDLQELPTKNTIPIYIDLDKEELKVYQEVLHFSKTLLAEYLRQKAGNANENIENIRNQLKTVEDIKTTEIFVLLLRLRQICCLPGLIHSFLEKEVCIESGIESEDAGIEDLNSQLSRLSIGVTQEVEQNIESNEMKNVLHKTNPVFKLDRPSTKILSLLEILKEILKTDDKIVIVSQWTNLLKKIETHIRSLGIETVTLDGTVPVKFRSKIIEEFNQKGNNVKIILLSLNAGGVGLNLTGGNRLIIFEPHWNPQLESQACDRIYRVGQKKEVFVYKIICRNTIEERIELLQKQKLELAKNILHETGKSSKSQAGHLTLPDLVTLFGL